MVLFISILQFKGCDVVQLIAVQHVFIVDNGVSIKDHAIEDICFNVTLMPKAWI